MSEKGKIASWSPGPKLRGPSDNETESKESPKQDVVDVENIEGEKPEVEQIVKPLDMNNPVEVVPEPQKFLDSQGYVRCARFLGTYTVITATYRDCWRTWNPVLQRPWYENYCVRGYDRQLRLYGHHDLRTRLQKMTMKSKTLL